jgi:hypothetical protein
MASAAEYLFSYIHPTEYGNIVLSLAAGHPLAAYRLTIDAVLPVIALAYIAWLRDQQIVDDYALLCQRYRDEFLTITEGKMPYSPADWWVSFIVQQERGGRNYKNTVLESWAGGRTEWLFDAYDQLINTELEELWQM